MLAHKNFLPSTNSSENEVKFWRQLKDSNSPEVVRTAERIVEWLRANEFGLGFGKQESVCMDIAVEKNGQFLDTAIRITSRERVPSPAAEVRFRYRYMKAGEFKHGYMKFALQKKILREGFPIRCGTTQQIEWDPEYFETGKPHFYVYNIDDGNLAGFYRILQFVKDIIMDDGFEPPDWDHLIAGWTND